MKIYKDVPSYEKINNPILICIFAFITTFFFLINIYSLFSTLILLRVFCLCHESIKKCKMIIVSCDSKEIDLLIKSKLS